MCSHVIEDAAEARLWGQGGMLLSSVSAVVVWGYGEPVGRHQRLLPWASRSSSAAALSSCAAWLADQLMAPCRSAAADPSCSQRSLSGMTVAVRTSQTPGSCSSTST